MKRRLLLFLLCMVVGSTYLRAQPVPFEVFSGKKATTLDLLLIKNLKTKEEEKSRFLFFSRSRATIDYDETTTSDLPQFALTEALSYNLKNLKDLRPLW